MRAATRWPAAWPPGCRILERGAGSGVVGAVLARNCAPEAILSVKANPNLLPHIKRFQRHNGLEGIMSVRHGVVLTDPATPPAVEFFVSGNCLGSGLQRREGKRAQPVQVPVLRYAELRAAFPTMRS